MNRDYKINDIVYTDKLESSYWNRDGSSSLYGKIAKIIDINNEVYTLEFKKYIAGHDGYGKGKKGYCWNCSNRCFKLAIDHLKFKKWIKG